MEYKALFKKIVMVNICAIAVIVLCCGCNNRVPSSGQLPGSGLLVDNGISSPDQVQYVIYQHSTFTLPMPKLFPLQPPHRITNITDIRAFYDALDHPKGALMPKTASNSRVGFITKDGRVVIFAVGGAECETAKANIAPVLKLAYKIKKQKECDTTYVPAGRVIKLKYIPGKGGKSITLIAGSDLSRVEKVWQQLLATYNPLSLRGNVHLTHQEVIRFLASVPEYIKVKVQRPVQYEAIVVPPDLDPKWPPDKGDNRSRLKKLQYDTIYIARIGEIRYGHVVFIFASNGGNYLSTDAVDPRAILNYNGKSGRPTFGPDLFDKIVSEIKKP